MKYTDLKTLLSDPDAVSKSQFSILMEIARRVNRQDLRAEGQDLVIRSLAVLDSFGRAEQRILFSMVRNVGLFPYLTGHLESTDLSDQLAYELHRAENLGPNVVFHSLQAKIFHQIMAGANVVLSASTSVGKSLVIDAIVASNKYKKIVIIVPTIALIDETRKRLMERFGDRSLIITHRSQPSREGIANIFVLTQERVLQRDDLDGVDLVIVDEFYKMNLDIDETPDRAIDLNVAFHRLIRTGTQFYLLGPNINAISGLESHEHHFFPDKFTTVAVDVIEYNLPTRGDDRAQQLLSLCQTLDDPTIIYCQSPKSATDVALFLIRSGSFPQLPSMADAVDWIGKHYHPDWSVARAVGHGIGLHHGGVPRALQQYFIRQFNARQLPFIVCTSTIIEGVNTSARNVIIFDRRKNQSVLDHFTYKNIQGRAGRMKQYYVGRVYVLESPPSAAEFSVECPVGNQSEKTPVDLLMGLEDDDLTTLSKGRLNDVFKGSSLTEATLRANRHVPVAVQELIAQVFRDNPLRWQLLLGWKGVPNADSLRAVCGIIRDYLEPDTLKDYGIFTGDQLAWNINAIRMDPDRSIATFLRQRIEGRNEEDTVSDAIEKAMKFLRNIVCQRFPQDLMVIDNIQKEVLASSGFDPGSYSLFAEQAESCFVPPLLFALDEYGLPTQTAQKLAWALLPADNLNTVLRRLQRLSSAPSELFPFERDLIEDIKSTLHLPPPPVRQ